jgi:hypothetical protein
MQPRRRDESKSVRKQAKAGEMRVFAGNVFDSAVITAKSPGQSTGPSSERANVLGM